MNCKEKSGGGGGGRAPDACEVRLVGWSIGE